MKKDFTKIPTDLNSTYIDTELVNFWIKLDNCFFFAVLKEQLQHIRTKASTLTPLLSDQ